MIGEKLNKANEWMNKAIRMEEDGKQNMMHRCLNKAVLVEEEGLKEGESWI